MVDNTPDHTSATETPLGGSEVCFVLFDLGGVLVEVDEQLSRARWVDLGYPEDRYDAAFYGSHAKPGGDLGDHSPEGMRCLVEALAGSPVSPEALIDIWGAHVSWRAGVRELLSRLTVPYGVLSTIDPIHAAVLGPLPGAHPILYSCDMGLMKPSLAAFRMAAEACPCPVESVLYVDDRAENVSAALRVGFDAHQVDQLRDVVSALRSVLRP